MINVFLFLWEKSCLVASFLQFWCHFSLLDCGFEVLYVLFWKSGYKKTLQVTGHTEVQSKKSVREEASKSHAWRWRSRSSCESCDVCIGHTDRRRWWESSRVRCTLRSKERNNKGHVHKTVVSLQLFQSTKRQILKRKFFSPSFMTAISRMPLPWPVVIFA